MQFLLQLGQEYAYGDDETYRIIGLRTRRDSYGNPKPVQAFFVWVEGGDDSAVFEAEVLAGNQFTKKPMWYTTPDFKNNFTGVKEQLI